MSWGEKRARQAIKRAPDGAKVVMRSGTFSHYDPAADLLSGMRMNFIRHFLTMAIELDEEPEKPAWPTGIKVRSMESIEELETVVHAVRDSFKDHWGFLETPYEQEFDQWLHFVQNDEEYDPTLWFLAMDGKDVAGISLCRHKSDEDPEIGWVNVLGVLRPWRRKGLGLALLNHSFRELKRRGQGRAGLGVDASSLTGATGLYEKAGMHSIRQFDLYEKELRPGQDLTKQSI
jgi:ribosomal protein S18 acetylase RimI-like enzyme